MGNIVASLYCVLYFVLSSCLTPLWDSLSPGDECQSQSELLCAKLMRKKSYLVSLEIGPAAGGEALLAAEALQLTPHAQGIALNADFLAPGAHDLHVGCIFIWNRATGSGSDSR